MLASVDRLSTTFQNTGSGDDEQVSRFKEEIEKMQKWLRMQLQIFITMEVVIALISLSMIFHGSAPSNQSPHPEVPHGLFCCSFVHTAVLALCLLEMAATIIVFFCHYWRMDVQLLQGRFYGFSQRVAQEYDV